MLELPAEKLSEKKLPCVTQDCFDSCSWSSRASNYQLRPPAKTLREAYDEHCDFSYSLGTNRQGFGKIRKPYLRAIGVDAVKRAGVEFFRLYGLRHTFATRATEAGVDIMTLAALLGHSRVQMVMRYAHPSEEHQFSAVRKIEACNAARGM